MSQDKLKAALELLHDHARLHNTQYTPGQNVYDSTVAALASQEAKPQEVVSDERLSSLIAEAQGSCFSIVPQFRYVIDRIAAPTPPAQSATVEAATIEQMRKAVLVHGWYDETTHEYLGYQERAERARQAGHNITTLYTIDESLWNASQPAQQAEPNHQELDMGQANKDGGGLQGIEQYRLQMAAISTAAIGYWKEGDDIHPDYMTPALLDVARLYAKYDALYQDGHAATTPQAEPLYPDAPDCYDGWPEHDSPTPQAEAQAGETPRTDAVAFDVNGITAATHLVPADSARQLERELQAANERAERLARTALDVVKQNEELRDYIAKHRAQLAAQPQAVEEAARVSDADIDIAMMKALKAGHFPVLFNKVPVGAELRPFVREFTRALRNAGKEE